MTNLTVETKYKLGQEVFYMEKNRIQSGIVGFINVKLYLLSGRHGSNGEFRIEVDYGLLSGYLVPSGASFEESSLFASKEELLKSL